MTLNEYQRLAMRTDSPKYESDMFRLLNGVMGLNGEAGEAIDIVKKKMFQGHKLDRDKLIEELGDSLWYLALCADAMGISLEDIAKKNISKLMLRYPKGFTAEASIERVDHEEPSGESLL